MGILSVVDHVIAVQTCINPSCHISFQHNVKLRTTYFCVYTSWFTMAVNFFFIGSSVDISDYKYFGDGLKKTNY